MRHVAQAGALAGDGQRQQLLLLGHVVEFEFDADVAAGILDLASDQDVGLLEQVPGRKLDLAAARGIFDDVALGQGAELAAAVQIVADHGSGVGIRRQAGALERERNHRDRRGRGGSVLDVDGRHVAAQALRDGADDSQHQDERSEDFGEDPLSHGGFHPS